MEISPLCVITAAMVVLSDSQERSVVDTYQLCGQTRAQKRNGTFKCNESSLILLTNITNPANETDVSRFESLKRDCMGKSSCDPRINCENSHPLTVHYMCVDKSYVRSSSCQSAQKVTDYFGYIQSPGYPGPFVTGEVCSWEFNVPVDKAVVIMLHDLDINLPDNCETTLVVSGAPCQGNARSNTYFCRKHNTTSVIGCGKTEIKFQLSRKTRGARFWLSFCVLQRDHVSTFSRSALHCSIPGYHADYGQGLKDHLGTNSQDSNTEVLVIMLSIISGISAVLLIILIVVCVRCRLTQASGADSAHIDPSASVQTHYEYPSNLEVEKPRPRLADGYFEVSDALPFVERLEPPTSPTYAEVEHTVGIRKVFHLTPTDNYPKGPKCKARPGDGDNQRHNLSASSVSSQTESQNSQTKSELDAHKGDNSKRRYENITRDAEVQTMSISMEEETISKNTPGSSQIILSTQRYSESDGSSTYEMIGKAPADKTALQPKKRNNSDSTGLPSDVCRRNVPTTETSSKNLQNEAKPNSKLVCDDLSPTHSAFTIDHTYFVLEKRNRSVHIDKSEPADMRARSKSLPSRKHDFKKQHKRTAFEDIAPPSGAVKNGIIKFELNSS